MRTPRLDQPGVRNQAVARAVPGRCASSSQPASPRCAPSPPHRCSPCTWSSADVPERARWIVRESALRACSTGGEDRRMIGPHVPAAIAGAGEAAIPVVQLDEAQVLRLLEKTLARLMAIGALLHPLRQPPGKLSPFQEIRVEAAGIDPASIRYPHPVPLPGGEGKLGEVGDLACPCRACCQPSRAGSSCQEQPDRFLKTEPGRATRPARPPSAHPLRSRSPRGARRGWGSRRGRSGREPRWRRRRGGAAGAG